MPLTGRAKRNYNRTSRYGNIWRQLYYSADGMCELCKSVDDLEIHEETDGITVSSWRLVCRQCHIEVIHKDSYGGKIENMRRRYCSQLADDISQEVIESGGLEAWKKLYRIKDKDE